MKSKLLSVSAMSALAGFVLPTESVAQLDQIVVTAQKREENLQDVPIAITAVQTDDLLERGVADVQSLGQAIPGLVVSRQVNAVAPIIRGIGQTNQTPGADLGVATYLDGVYLSSMRASDMRLANIERIEVLKGPQGTLFGRNATGGLLHIITKAPSQEFSGTASIAVSNPLTIEGQLYVTGGLTDRIAVSVAGYWREQEEGFGENLFTGNDARFRDERSVRGKALIDISENTKLTISADYGKNNTDLGANRSHTDDSIRLDGQPNPEDFWDYDSYLDAFIEAENWGVAGTLEHEFSFADSKTIVAYRKLDSFVETDQSFNRLPLVFFSAGQFDKTFTIESHLTSKAESPIDWIVGVFYLEAEPGNGPLDCCVPIETAVLGDVFFRTFNRIDTNSIAGFGQATVPVNDRLNVTAGIRWTRDEKTRFSEATVLGLGELVGPNDKESWSELTWRAALDYHLTEDVLTYFSYNRGFKSGIWNLADFPIATAPVVDPETVDAFEIGVKSEFPDQGLRLNLAIYYNDYRNIQVQTTLAGNIVTANAAEATTYGGEVELLYAAAEGLDIFANAAYTNTEYDSFTDAGSFALNVGQCAGVPYCNTVIDATGNRFDAIPEWTFNVGGKYEKPVSFGHVGISTNVSYIGERFWGFENAHRSDPYALLTADIYARFGPDERYEARLFGRNLTRSEYAIRLQPQNFNIIEDPGEGRVVGVKLSADF